jgi:DNA polymerase-3 subunit epsilon
MSIPTTLLILDTETTGLDPTTDSLVEVGAILFSVPHRAVIQQVSFLLPCTENPALHVNRIAPDLTRLVDCSLALEMFQAMAGEADAFIAHNAAFDAAFLDPLLTPALRSIPWICTCEGIRWPGLRLNPSLTDLALAYGVPVWAAHRALTDCTYLAQVLARDTELERHLIQGLEPRRLVVAQVSYDEREQAKAAGFRWDPAAKQWSRRCSQSEIDELGFAVVEAATGTEPERNA